MHVDDTRQESGGCEGCETDTLVFDDTGELVEELVPIRTRPCALSTLNGSWLLQIVPKKPAFPPSHVRGPMRIEVADKALRVSGDIYVRRLVLPPLPGQPGDGNDGGSDGGAINTRRPWYPQLPMNQYAWYFRAVRSTYATGTLTVAIERHLWDRTAQEFVQTDAGQLVLTCRQSLFVAPFRPVVMTGTLRLGGRDHTVTATKTSDLYRGCRIEADVMTGRQWPMSATLCTGVTTTFRDVYLSAGWDVQARVDQVDVPDDAALTNTELQTLLATHRGPGTVDEWRLWLLAGSTQGGLFGIMFDDDSVPREGAVGFADATLGDDDFIEPAARNKPLDEVPAAFLRTLTHEAGHALNLFHPKHDVHNPPIGTEIMNQTGDVMGFASPANPYPCNATFAFAEHDRLSLIHSPDPQVRPGWRPFGWGHGDLSAGLPVPVDADGLATATGTDGLALELTLPADTFVGEYVVAEVTLANTGAEPRTVTTRLNLAEGDLRLLQVTPGGKVEQVRDVVVACGPRTTAVLEPGQSLTGRMQVFFTSEGVTFDRPGPYRVVAELDVDGVHTLRSSRVTVHVRTAANDAERALSLTTLERPVGLAIALGDFGADEELAGRMEAAARAYPEHDTGAALALVLANAYARSHTDFRAGVSRDAAPDTARDYLDLAVSGRTADHVLVLAATVASPTERDAPVVRDALDRVRGTDSDGGTDAAVGRAETIAADFVAMSPR